MKNNHIIIENSLTYITLYLQKHYPFIKLFFSKWMVIEMLLNNDIQLFFVQMILNFQKVINVIMYIIEIKNKNKLESFHLNKISIRYQFSKFMFL
jgi:hypothetical protein